MDGHCPVEGTIISKCPEAITTFWQNAGASCPCPKNLLQATLQKFGPISLAEEIQDGLVLTMSYGY